MAALTVEAISEDTIAAPGDRDNNYICVSVTRRTGNPVTGLGETNFSVDPMIVGPGGALVDIDRVTAGRLPGFYNVQVKPIGTQTWKSGTYIFAVAVDQGPNQGQTLTSVLLD